MKTLITGSNGLIGSQCVKFFSQQGEVIGIDNDMRSYFFGDESSTKSVGEDLKNKIENFTQYDIDIRNKDDINTLFQEHDFDLIIHTAAQPSHDWASKEPITDFEVNALGTINLLESYRTYSPNAVFIFTSTNKVYGDNPNRLNLVESDTRLDYYNENGHLDSVDENMSIDNCLHSVFGASKVAADIMVQEYGRYFGLKTTVFRGGCLTGPDHQGAELHGFLSYLIKCMVHNKHYTIYGSGKQVRDNIHSFDLVNLFSHVYELPRTAAVYNIGGGRENSISILEAIDKINSIIKENGGQIWNDYTIEDTKWRIGDHKWYISNLDKVMNDYPSWNIKYKLDDLLEEMVLMEMNNGH